MRVDSRMRSVAALVVAWALVLGIAVGPRPALSLDVSGALVDLVKIFGIAWVVRQFDDEIDDAINGVLAQHEAQVAGATKVVPILRVGEGGGTAVGAAQVMGPQQQVRTVEAVAEVELSVGDLRGRALIPVSTRRGLDRSPDAVPGVGVSANIKFPI